MFIDFKQEENKTELENWFYPSQAREAGFKFLLTNDGDADVLAPDGEIFTVKSFKCKCRNHIYRTHCFHELWVRQLRPCEQCGSIMELCEQGTCFGESIRLFECSSCANARDLNLVKEERSIELKDNRLTPNGRCKQAAAWLKAKQSDFYIWELVYNSPELIGTMVTVLSEIGEDMLADEIISRAGYKAA